MITGPESSDHCSYPASASYWGPETLGWITSAGPQFSFLQSGAQVGSTPKTKDAQSILVALKEARRGGGVRQSIQTPQSHFRDDPAL